MASDYKVSAPALYAARTILKKFRLEPIDKIAATEQNLAILVDITTQIFRVQPAMKEFVSQVPWPDKQGLKENIELLQTGIRALEVVSNRLPAFRDDRRRIVIANR